MSGANSKLGWQLVRPSLQSVPEPPEVNVLDMGQFLEVFDVQWPWPFELKIGTPLTRALANVILIFLVLFSSHEPVRDRRTDAQIDVRQHDDCVFIGTSMYVDGDGES